MAAQAEDGSFLRISRAEIASAALTDPAAGGLSSDRIPVGATYVLHRFEPAGRLEITFYDEAGRSIESSSVEIAEDLVAALAPWRDLWTSPDAGEVLRRSESYQYAPEGARFLAFGTELESSSTLLVVEVAFGGVAAEDAVITQPLATGLGVAAAVSAVLYDSDGRELYAVGPVLGDLDPAEPQRGADRYLMEAREIAAPGGGPFRLVVATARPRLFFDRGLLVVPAAGAVLTLIAVLITLAVSLPLIRSLRKLSSLADSLGRLSLDVPTLDSPKSRELSGLNDHMESMRYVLHAVSRYLPRTLVQQFLERTMDPDLGGTWKDITVMITGVRGFTAIAEGENPGILCLQLSEYFRALGRSIREYQGIIDTFNGDSLLVLWNAVQDVENHHRKALLAALGMRYAMETVNELWEANGQPRYDSRIGIHSGPAIVGNIGNEDRLEFTAVGGSVTLAGRLEAMNRHFGTDILVSKEVLDGAGAGFVVRQVGRVRPRGATDHTDVFELVGAGWEATECQTKTPDEDRQKAAAWNEILKLFYERTWDRAYNEIEEFLSHYPDDDIAAFYRTLIVRYQKREPGTTWRGLLSLG